MRQPHEKSAKTLTTYQTMMRGLNSRALNAVRSLETRARGPLKLRWNTRTGGPRSVRGVLSDPVGGTPPEIARQFLAQHGDLFGLTADLSDLQYVQTTERRGIRHVTFRQRYRDLPVFGAEILVHLDQADRVQMVNGEYCPDVNVDMTATPIPKAQAFQVVLADLDLTGSLPADARAELVIFPRGNTYCRAYKVTMTVKNPVGNWVYFVDAVSGDILDSYNDLRFLKGKGSIYNSNPKREDNEVVTTELFDLKGDKTLAGTYFIVENDAGPEALASSETQEFVYDAANTHFDEVMVYYHLSKGGEFFRNLGHPASSTPMNAHVHVVDPDTGNPHYDNAYYSPNDYAIYFGDGEVFNDPAKEAAVIYHEYTHAVVDEAQPVMATHEASALHEGYADYFACSITNDPQIGEYFVQKVGEPYLRNLRSQKTYQQFSGVNVHTDGEIWGVTCWKLHEALGIRIADMLLYESLWFLPSNATFVDAYEGLMQADTHIFNGEHGAEIETIFTEQQIIGQPVETYTILASAGSGGSIIPSGSVSVNRGENLTLTIIPDSGYVVQDVRVDDASVGKVTSYTFTQITGSHTIQAIFEKSAVYEQTLVVPGNTQWLNTGIVVSAGDQLTFTARGQVIYDKTGGNACGPGGAAWTDTQDKEDPLWAKPHSGLIGKFGVTGAPFFIGASYTVKAGGRGSLFLGINDRWYQGNTGEFTVTVKVVKPT